MQTVEEKVKKYVTSDGYKFDDYDKARMHEQGIPYGNYYVQIDNAIEFEVTEKHLKLLKRCQIDWAFSKDHYCAGNFYQDAKRPYGNSDWIGDLGEILEVEPDLSDKDSKWFSDKLVFELVKHHIDMKVVVPILLTNLSITVGKYRRSTRWTDNWQPVS